MLQQENNQRHGGVMLLRIPAIMLTIEVDYFPIKECHEVFYFSYTTSSLSTITISKFFMITKLLQVHHSYMSIRVIPVIVCQSSYKHSLMPRVQTWNLLYVELLTLEPSSVYVEVNISLQMCLNGACFTLFHLC